MKKTFLLVMLLPLFACSLAAQAIPGLGTATFPTSTHSAAAQSDFMRGLLLLHLFEYPDAAKSFVAAEKADPGFAMAYWGEAMTFNHPVWNEVDVRRVRPRWPSLEPLRKHEPAALPIRASGPI